jgi:hypothetical protein
MKQTLFLFLLVFYSYSNAQDYTIGLRAGLNYYNIGDINSRAYEGRPEELFTPNREIGTQFGMFLNVEFEKMFIRPELNYVSSKNNYSFPLKTSVWKTSKFDIPILVGYQIFDPVSIYAGPGINIYNKTKLDGVQVTSYSDGGPDLEKTTFNINFGIMARYGRFGIDLRYEVGLEETKEELLDIIHSEYGVNLVDAKAYRPSIISLSVIIDVFTTDGGERGGFFSNLFKKKCYCPY